MAINSNATIFSVNFVFKFIILFKLTFFVVFISSIHSFSLVILEIYLNIIYITLHIQSVHSFPRFFFQKYIFSFNRLRIVL